MSSVEQRVDPQPGNDPTLENHEIATPAADLEVSLDFDHERESKRGTEKVIEQERLRAAAAPREELRLPIDPLKISPLTEHLIVERVAPTPKEDVETEVILKKKEPEKAIEREPRQNKMFPPRPEMRQPEQRKPTHEATPQIIKKHEEPQVQRHTPQPIEPPRVETASRVEAPPIKKLKEPQAVVNRTVPVQEEPLEHSRVIAKENSPKIEEKIERTVPLERKEIEPSPTPARELEPRVTVTPEIRPETRQQEIATRIEHPTTLQQTVEPEHTPRLSLEEKIERLRVEMNIKPVVVEEIDHAEIREAAPVSIFETGRSQDNETLIPEQPTQRIVTQPEHEIVVESTEPLPEPELLMEQRRTPTLEQAMKFQFARAKISTGKKVAMPGFRGHSLGSGTILDKLVTYLADLIKKFEIRLFSLLTRRRMERRTKAVKVVPTEKEEFHLESFPRSLSKERKKKKRWFFSRFSK